MKEESKFARELEDFLIADTRDNCCISCDKYNTVKEMKKWCQPMKARHRISNREMRKAISIERVV